MTSINGTRVRRAVPGEVGIYTASPAGEKIRPPYKIKGIDASGKQFGPVGNYPTLAEARHALATLTGAGEGNPGIVISRETFKDYALRYHDDHADANGTNPVAPETKTMYVRCLHNHVFPHIGRKAIMDITTADVRLLLKAMTTDRVAADLKPLSKSTITNVFKAVNGPLNRAVAERLLTHNPVSLLERNEVPKTERKGYRILSEVEINRFLEAAGRVTYSIKARHVAPTHRPQLIVALLGMGLLAGMRIGEVLGLTWGDIDFENRLIRIERQTKPGYRGYHAPETLPLPKMGKRRTAVLAPRLSRTLRELQMAIGRIPAADDFIFASGYLDGRPYSQQQVQDILAKVVEEAQIGAATDWTLVHDLPLDAKLTYHSLRHTFISAMIAGGLSKEQVSRQVGNSPREIEKTYEHLFSQRNEHDEVAAKLERAFGS